MLQYAIYFLKGIEMNCFKRLLTRVNPAVLIIIGLMLANNMLTSNQSFGGWLYEQILFLPGILVGLTFHEAAHGYASYWLGDPTPKAQGRLSLNPFRHLDPIGFLALFFAGFGWGKPVEINPLYYKNKRRDQLIVSLAGVITNFVIAILACLAMKFTLGYMGDHGWSFISQTVLYIFNYMLQVNIVLMAFNLLPVPPLDGFGVLTEIFNFQKYDWYYKVYSNGLLILMLLIIFNVTDKILTPIVSNVYGFMFLNIIGIG